LREEHRLRVFENRVLGKILGSKRDEVREEWRRLHNEKLYNLYSSPNIIWEIKSRIKMGGACGMYGRQREMLTGFWWGDLMEIGYLEDLGIDRSIILQ
jgi:hypothetical protein